MRRHLYLCSMPALMLVVAVICILMLPSTGYGPTGDGIKVVQGAAPASGSPKSFVPLQAVDPHPPEAQRIALAENVSRSIETQYGVVKRANVSCSGEVCVLDAALNDISNDDDARSLDTLLDSNMGLILARNGFSPQGNVVIDVMSGVYTGFHVEMRRR